MNKFTIEPLIRFGLIEYLCDQVPDQRSGAGFSIVYLLDFRLLVGGGRYAKGTCYSGQPKKAIKAMNFAAGAGTFKSLRHL